jgi:hypothetical protein
MELGSHTCIVNHRNMGRSPTTHILAKLNCEKNPIVLSNLPRPSKTGWGGENWDGPGLHGWPGSTPFHLRSWRTFVYTTRDKLRPWVENRNSSMTGVHPMYQEFTTIVIAIVIIIIITTIIILFNLLIWLKYNHHWFFIYRGSPWLPLRSSHSSWPGRHAPFLQLVAEVHAEIAHAGVQVDQTSPGALEGWWSGKAGLTGLT